YDSGERYRFGPVTFEGSQIRDEYLQNLLPFKEGDEYESKDLACLVYGWSAAMDIDRRMPSVHSVDVLPAWDESRVENADERVVI
ncbi:hypothetical protein MJN76_32945, partial [Salmonella enterica subsp. enterica serovar Anatum]|nr:hypothetical protein [Salmonella enterica subsp. enterica serovar Anatum]